MTTMSAGELIETFRARTIAHPILRRVDAEAREAITAPDSKDLVLIFGPTGVGKTTLIRRVKKVLDEEIIDELRADTTRATVPVVSAVAPEAASFRWKEFYRRVLRALNHPFADEQVRAAGPRPDADELRTRLENTIAYLRPRAVIVDEAHHIGVGASHSQLVKQLEIIKSLASASGTRYVLVGTYSLLAFRNLNGQLSRRSKDVHFPRYGAATEELQAFRETLEQLAAWLPIPAPSIGSSWDELYERTAGCIGILKDWLTQALALALGEGAESLRWDHLARTSMGVAAMTSIALEIRDGEEALAENDDSRSHLRSLLGLAPESPAVPNPVQQTRFKPGERKPSRDRVLLPSERGTADVVAA